MLSYFTMFNRLGRQAVSLYSHFQFQLDITGSHLLPPGPKILVANHPSTSDPFLITTLTSEPIHLLVHQTFFNVPLVGTYLRLAGHIPAHAGNGSSVIDQSCCLLQQGKNLAVFIEGGISPKEGFHPPKTGSVRIALRSGVPIIPIGIHLPKHKIRYLTTSLRGHSEVGRFYFGGPYHITIGQPQYLSGDFEDRQLVSHLTRRLMDQVINLSSQSQNRYANKNSNI